MQAMEMTVEENVQAYQKRQFLMGLLYFVGAIEILQILWNPGYFFPGRLFLAAAVGSVVWFLNRALRRNMEQRLQMILYLECDPEKYAQIYMRLYPGTGSRKRRNRFLLAACVGLYGAGDFEGCQRLLAQVTGKEKLPKEQLLSYYNILYALCVEDANYQGLLKLQESLEQVSCDGKRNLQAMKMITIKGIQRQKLYREEGFEELEKDFLQELSRAGWQYTKVMYSYQLAGIYEKTGRLLEALRKCYYVMEAGNGLFYTGRAKEQAQRLEQQLGIAEPVLDAAPEPETETEEQEVL